MKSLIRNFGSIFENGIAARKGHASTGQGDAIVSGYSLLSDAIRQESTTESRDHGLAGILYAEIANYSRYTTEDVDVAEPRLVESVRLLKAQVAVNEGRLVHAAGDAILAEFADVGSALRCAIEVQLAARELNARLHVDRWVQFRMGVKTGESIADCGDIYSNAIKLATWLERLAHSEGICVSESVRLAMESHPAFHFVALGKQYVKNIDEPVQVFWIELDARQVNETEFLRPDDASALAS